METVLTIPKPVNSMHTHKKCFRHHHALYETAGLVEAMQPPSMHGMPLHLGTVEYRRCCASCRVGQGCRCHEGFYPCGKYGYPIVFTGVAAVGLNAESAISSWPKLVDTNGRSPLFPSFEVAVTGLSALHGLELTRNCSRRKDFLRAMCPACSRRPISRHLACNTRECTAA